MSNPSTPSELIVFPDGVTYRRSGTCDGCGGKAACCQYVLLPDRSLNADETHWLALHGLDESAPRNIRIDVACEALDEDGSCRLFGTESRPQMCSNYPELPGLDPECSYTFERVA